MIRELNNVPGDSSSLSSTSWILTVFEDEAGRLDGGGTDSEAGVLREGQGVGAGSMEETEELLAAGNIKLANGGLADEKIWKRTGQVLHGFSLRYRVDVRLLMRSYLM